jgi:hypothetical protein
VNLNDTVWKRKYSIKSQSGTIDCAVHMDRDTIIKNSKQKIPFYLQFKNYIPQTMGNN